MRLSSLPYRRMRDSCVFVGIASVTDVLKLDYLRFFRLSTAAVLNTINFLVLRCIMCFYIGNDFEGLGKLPFRLKPSRAWAIN